MGSANLGSIDQITDGPFAGFADPTGGTVQREGDPLMSMWGRAELNQQGPTFDNYFDFASFLEGVHGNFHIAVGGFMSDLSLAPADPIFYTHHAFVDRLWAEWQNQGGGNHFGGLQPAFEEDGVQPVEVTLDSPMRPWGTTAREVLNEVSDCVRYAGGEGDVARQVVDSENLGRNIVRQGGYNTNTNTGGLRKKFVSPFVEDAVAANAAWNANVTVMFEFMNFRVVPRLTRERKKGYQLTVANEKIQTPQAYKALVRKAVELTDVTVDAMRKLGNSEASVGRFARLCSKAKLQNGVDLVDADIINKTDEEVVEEGRKEKAAIESGDESSLKAAKKDEASPVTVATED